MNCLFDLDKGAVRRSFAAAFDTYDEHADLQNSAGETLLQLYAGKSVSGQVLDLGCGTGFLTKRLAHHNTIAGLTAVDIAFAMVQAARSRVVAPNYFAFVSADAESLPIKSQCQDWIFSNLAFQWCRNLNAVFAEVKRCLKPHGQLVFSTFGPETLKELKWAWSQIDDYPHVNQFYGQQQIVDCLRQQGLENIRVERRCYVSKYQSTIQLMRQLKGIGAHNINGGRNRAITGKDKFKQMLAVYEQFASDGFVPATFEIIYVAAQAND